MSTNLITFVTGVHFTASMLRAFKSMTFLFNPNWEQSQTEYSTLPFSCFHVTSCKEIMASDISQRQMLFYNSLNTAGSSSTQGGLLSVVADNIVNKPKVYSMDIIIPYNTLNLLTNTAYMSTEQLSMINTVLFTNGSESGLSTNFTTAMTVVSVLKSLFNMLITTIDFTSVNNLLTRLIDTTGVNYNKKSLEAMRDNRAILKLKMWDNWAYKYVAISNLEITKEPTEDGVYRGTLTCQEVPMLNIRQTEKVSAVSTDAFTSTGASAISTVINTKEVSQS